MHGFFAVAQVLEIFHRKIPGIKSSVLHLLVWHAKSRIAIVSYELKTLELLASLILFNTRVFQKDINLDN